MNQIKLIQNKYKKYCHAITANDIQIGTISFAKRNHMIVIEFLELYPEYRRQGYGYQIIEHLLSHYKVNCIIGETLYSSRGFWHKCIQKYNGQRHNISYSDNCSSSFVIPKYPVTNDEIYSCLEYVAFL